MAIDYSTSTFSKTPARRRPSCAVCGEPVLRQCERVRPATCSAKCGYALRKNRTRKQRPCRVCAKLFWPMRQGSGVFETHCSRSCYYAGQAAAHPRVEIECAQCRKVVTRQRSQANRIFCSRECSVLYLRDERHPNYRGNKDPNRGPGWSRLAETIRVRDGRCCRRCGAVEPIGTKKKFPVDHLIPWRLFENKADANDPSNLFTLCMSCHGYKTGYVERRYLRGDMMAFVQFRESLTLPSAVA